MMRRRRRTAPQPPSGGPTTRRMRLAQLQLPQIDHISDLPNDVLGEIIAKLPVEDAVRSQVLASRWRHLWRSTLLSLDCGEGRVNLSRVLQAHPGPGRRFRVRTVRQAAEVDAWLRSAALDDLHELDFAGYAQRLPASIFRCSQTLRALTLARCKLSVFQGLHFPRLKMLGLQRVRVPDDLSLQSLVDGCPTLEFLLVHTVPGFRRLRINSRAITSICVRVNDLDTRRSALQPHTEELVIENAPRLERLIHLYAIGGCDLSVFSAPKVETLGVLADWHNFYTGLVSCSRVIRGLPVDSPAKVVHTVKSLAVNMSHLSIRNVVVLLRLFPCLEKLHVKSSRWLESNCWRRKHQNLHDIRLKTVVLEPYRGNMQHVNFAKFFVMKAKVLELMTFHIDAKYNNDEFLAEQHRKLDLENKASRDARFHFTTTSCQHAAWNKM